VVQGNLIGTNALGTAAIPNRRGVEVGAVPPGGPTLRALIGGENAGVLVAGNVISGNATLGISLRAGEGHRVEGNIVGFVSFPIFGTPLPNNGPGVVVSGGSLYRIGSLLDDSRANLIGNNAGPGVLLVGPADNALGPQDVFIGVNRYHTNEGLAIDLSRVNGGDEVTANDPLDADQGPNGLQNFPELTAVQHPPGQTQIQGRLRSTPSRSFYIDVYRTLSCDPSGHGPGTEYLGIAFVTTDASGEGTFSLTLDAVVTTGFATATATTFSATLTNLATSEFSACMALEPGPEIFADGFE
jgi:hypothetical protein